MAPQSTDLSSPSTAGSFGPFDQSTTVTSIWWPLSSNDGARSCQDTSFRLLRFPSAYLVHEGRVRIDCFSRKAWSSLVHSGFLIRPFHHARSVIHLTLLPGRAGLLSKSRFDIPWA